MKSKKLNTAVIANALIWAFMMLAAASLFQGADQSKEGIFLSLMVAGWFTTQGLILGAQKGQTYSDD